MAQPTISVTNIEALVVDCAEGISIEKHQAKLA